MRSADTTIADHFWLAAAAGAYVKLRKSATVVRGLAVKNFDSRTNSIQDFVEYDKQKALVLNPAFQRRAVWNEKAKSYLIDTILRGKPIPKIFMRQ